jgi:3-oxoacyl-[acyl-carrier protein] reductase
MSNYVFFGSNSDCAIASIKQAMKDGHNVFLVGRNYEQLEDLCSIYGCKMHHIKIMDIHNVEQALHVAEESIGTIDGIVNFCGSLLLKPLHLTSEKDFHQVIDDNLHTAFCVAHGAAKVMLNTGGSVILFSSAAADIGITNHELISCAKAGVQGLAKAASATYAKNKIRFNCICPGLIETKLTKSITSNDKALQTSLKMHPVGRLGSVNDISRLVLFYLDPASSFITGECIRVDGGLASLKTLA